MESQYEAQAPARGRGEALSEVCGCRLPLISIHPCIYSCSSIHNAVIKSSNSKVRTATTLYETLT